MNKKKLRKNITEAPEMRLVTPVEEQPEMVLCYDPQLGNVIRPMKRRTKKEGE